MNKIRFNRHRAYEIDGTRLFKGRNLDGDIIEVQNPIYIVGVYTRWEEEDTEIVNAKTVIKAVDVDLEKALEKFRELRSNDWRSIGFGYQLAYMLVGELGGEKKFQNLLGHRVPID